MKHSCVGTGIIRKAGWKCADEAARAKNRGWVFWKKGVKSCICWEWKSTCFQKRKQERWCFWDGLMMMIYYTLIYSFCIFVTWSRGSIRDLSSGFRRIDEETRFQGKNIPPYSALHPFIYCNCCTTSRPLRLLLPSTVACPLFNPSSPMFCSCKVALQLESTDRANRFESWTI